LSEKWASRRGKKGLQGVFEGTGKRVRASKIKREIRKTQGGGGKKTPSTGGWVVQGWGGKHGKV